MHQLLNMRFIFFFSLSFIFACQQPFVEIDPSTFNQQIKNNKKIESAEELIALYYNYLPSEEGGKPLIRSENLTENVYNIKLVHDGLLDDSQQAIQIIMQAEKNKANWVVKNIKMNWKCREGRGHSDWGIKNCN